jgi:hypothetical protein
MINLIPINEWFKNIDSSTYQKGQDFPTAEVDEFKHAWLEFKKGEGKNLTGPKEMEKAIEMAQSYIKDPEQAEDAALILLM